MQLMPRYDKKTYEKSRGFKTKAVFTLRTEFIQAQQKRIIGLDLQNFLSRRELEKSRGSQTYNSDRKRLEAGDLLCRSQRKR